MSNLPLNLTRAQLAEFLPNARAIRAFEQMLLQLNSLLPEQLTALQALVDATILSGGNADAKSNNLESILSHLSNIAAFAALSPATSDNNIDLAFEIAPPAIPERLPRYASFYDTTTQTASIINTAYAVKLNNTDLSRGVRVVSNSQVTVDAVGIYNIQFSLQLGKTSAGASAVYIWLRINGADVANSATKIRIQGNNAETVAAWNFMPKLNSGDYFQLMWSTDSTDTQIFVLAASGVVPAIPSALLTVSEVLG